MNAELIGAISELDYNFLVKAATLFIPDYDLVVYGSRARGDCRYNSDLDLAIYGSTSDPDRAILEFENIMEHSIIAPIVSVVMMNLISGRLSDYVLKEGVLIYNGAGEFDRLRAELALKPNED